MPRSLWQTALAAGFFALGLQITATLPPLTGWLDPALPHPHLGFDRNDYPGDARLAALRRRFSFTGYWLNVPPGGTTNTWAGKRDPVGKAGFGFLLLFNGRRHSELNKDPQELGHSDASAATAAARLEGFPQNAIIFLDQEEGGRMLPEQKVYIYAWVDGVNASGYRAGIYCSGIASTEAGGITVITAEDIRQSANGREIVYWVANDGCPPSPGCIIPRKGLPPSASGVEFAGIWQYAQSPKRQHSAHGCSGYARDGNCYPAELGTENLFVDLDSANSDDPSAGR